MITIKQGHPMVGFGNICSEGLKSPEIFGFNCSEASDFFGKTSRWTFVTRGLIISYCFRRDKYVVQSAK